jgi:hypothetical protein|tara:strand:- start:786 stop:1409 length:624 start_codon:yes stop_codon:yes gene_type:complete
MKSLRITLLVTLVLVLTQSCKILKNTQRKEQDSTNELIIYQNGVETSLSSSSHTVEIDKNAFSLRFFNKRYNSERREFYSTQIAAFTDKSELDKLKVGMSTSDLPCFKPGSGMAPNRSGKYESLIFNTRGHHYTFYENSESTRLNLLDNSGKNLKLEFEISSLYYDNTAVKMTNTRLQEFYIACLIDRNLNGTIDEGELTKLTIKIK